MLSLTKRVAIVPTLFIAALVVSSCKSDLGTATLGAAAAGGVYEYQNREALENLRRDHEEGRISRSEYLRRREEIESRSVIY